MSIKRVAVVFDNRLRPETTGVYCLRALAAFTHAFHVLPEAIDKLRPGEFDLVVNIDDGLRYRLPSTLRPCAWWVIDTHLDPEWAEIKGQSFDWLFAAQKDGAELLNRKGLPTQWLPLACDPEIHRPYAIPKTWDMGFIGRIAPGPRQELLELLKNHFPNSFIGQRFFEDFAQTYSACRVGFNRSVRNDVNMRVFETLGCGSMLLTNDLAENGQDELLRPDQHLVTYTCADELLEKMRYFLRNDAHRERIASAGHHEVIMLHTYLKRMETLLRTVENGLTRVSSGPMKAPLNISTSALESDRDVAGFVSHGTAAGCRRDELNWLNEIDVVIKTFLRPKALSRLLESILRYYPEAHVTIADDGDLRRRTDAESVYCQELLARHSQIQLLELPFAAGVVAGRNALVDSTTKPYVLILDDDFCFTSETRIERFWNCLKLNLEVGVVAGVCIDVLTDRRERRRSGGTLTLEGTTLRHETQSWRDRERGICDYVPQFALLRREVFKTIRWDLGIGGEHYDLLLQLLHSNWIVMQDESVQIDHHLLTPPLDGYDRFRNDVSRFQQAFLSKWNLETMYQDGQLILFRQSAFPKLDPSPVAQRPVKDTLYFEFPRPDVLELVPLSARRVLDIGCGGGRLGAQIRQRQGAEVIGIELVSKAAVAARERLDQVFEMDVELTSVDFPEGRFDCVICADVLEHLREPDIVLKKIGRWLTPDGSLVISLPNVRHHSVVSGLLAGNWTYETAGLLDADHVRFFTRRELEKLLYRQRFRISELRFRPGPGYSTWEQQGRPGEVRLGDLHISGMSPEDAEEFFIYQFLVVANPDQSDRRVCADSNDTGRINDFWQSNPWPISPPDIEVPENHLGWFGDGPREMLQKSIRPEMQLIVELGAWLGLSTRFIARQANHAKVITIDHWQGSPEHHTRPEWKSMLPTLFESFQVLNWNFRDRILPLRKSTEEGLRLIHAAGLRPGLIFIDADHSYPAVKNDLQLASSLFPDAELVGDDYDCPDVQQAVDEFAKQHHCIVETTSNSWRAWRLIRTTGQNAPLEQTLTSIIVVCFNQLAYTRECIDSINCRTDEPYELICIDNGSTDGTVEYLRSLDSIRVILNPGNLGFPKAVNQGLKIAAGNQILLLNNDTVVTTGWLRRMLDTLASSPEIGVVGPCSNCVSGPQQVNVTYRDLTCLDGFAWDWGKQHAGKCYDLERLIGFCLLFKRTVLETIGLLDERFEIGCFEDDDYCRRALNAGFRCVVAVDSFVHHYGNRTFAGSGIDLGKVLDENKKKYDKKWNKSEVAPVQPTTIQDQSKSKDSSLIKFEQSFVCAPKVVGGVRVKRAVGGGLELTESPIRISLCMIVRDNENTIGPCLESIQPWVDEIVVVDTGSKDSTPEICRYFGARVFDFAWIDDFAAARNESLIHARGQWLFWMDSDDTISAECGRGLRELVDGAHPANILGYVMQVHCPRPAADGSTDITIVDHIKLFPNRPDLRFEHRIHEQILPSIRRAGGEVKFTTIHVVHSGADHTQLGQRRKLERDFRLLNLDLKERPDHPFVLFNLGMTHADARQYDIAIHWLTRCLEVSKDTESHVPKTYALLVSSLSSLSQQERAWTVCRRGRELFPDDKELQFRQAMLAQQTQRLNEAVLLYQQVLKPSDNRRFVSLDAHLDGYKARHNLALVYEDLGKLAEAEAEWNHILNDCPRQVLARVALCECIIKQRRYADAKLLIELLKRQDHAEIEAIRLESYLYEYQGEVDQAIRVLEEGLNNSVGNTSLMREMARLQYQNGFKLAALATLKRLTEAAPHDRSAWNNLGVVLSDLNQHTQAQYAFERTNSLQS